MRPCCWPAAASATPCCSRSPRRCATNGNKVIYFAGYKKGEDLFKREEIEAATDQVIWSTDVGVEIAPGRPQDAHFRGNIVQAMVAYGEGRLGKQLVPLPDVTRIIAIGSDRMMAAVKAARYGALAPLHPARPRRHRQHQLADAVHDEGGLRAVPAEARRPGDRHVRSSSSPASTRIRRWTGRLPEPDMRACARTPCRRSCRTSGSTTCWNRSTCHACRGPVTRHSSDSFSASWRSGSSRRRRRYLAAAPDGRGTRDIAGSPRHRRVGRHQRLSSAGAEPPGRVPVPRRGLHWPRGPFLPFAPRNAGSMPRLRR